MSVDSFLVHTCVVERSTPTDNAYRNKTDAWREVSVDTPCRLVEKTIQVWDDQHRQHMPLHSYLAILPASADVLENDRLSHIVFEDATVSEKKFIIKSLVARRRMATHHKSAALEMV